MSGPSSDAARGRPLTYPAALGLRVRRLDDTCRMLEGSGVGVRREGHAWWYRPAKRSVRRSNSWNSQQGGGTMLRPTLHNLGDAISRDGDPAAPALIDVGAPGGPRTFSYGEFDGLANSEARGLLKRGLRTGERIAILSASRAELLLSFLA